MKRHWLNAVTALLIGAATMSGAAAADKPSWDGLVLVKGKKMDAVYLMPGADFSGYTKVMFDPTEAAFRKDWLRDYNRQGSSASRAKRITDADVEDALDTIRTKFSDTFAKVYSDGGYQVVTAPGPDVLRVRTGVMNLSVNAPDIMTSGHSRTLAPEAGEATLILEVRDSQTGALMGRAVDRRLAGDTNMMVRNSVTNRNDFSILFKDWAKESVAGLGELKALAGTDVAALKK